MLFNNERHPLLLKYFMTFLTCISKVRGACESICKPLIGHMVPFLLRSTLNFCTKYQNFGNLSALQPGWYATRICTHCCWGGSKASCNVWDRWEEILKACTSRSWVTPCGFHWGFHSDFTQNTRFWGPSQHGKLAELLWGATSIATEVVHDLPQMYKVDMRSF